MRGDWRWLQSNLPRGDGSDLEDLVPMQDGDATCVPRWIAELAWANYSRHYEQSFERLHERGGFSSGEVIGHLASELRFQQLELARARGDVVLLRQVVRDLIQQLGGQGTADAESALRRTRDE